MLSDACSNGREDSRVLVWGRRDVLPVRRLLEGFGEVLDNIEP